MRRRQAAPLRAVAEPKRSVAHRMDVITYSREGGGPANTREVRLREPRLCFPRPDVLTDASVRHFRHRRSSTLPRPSPTWLKAHVARAAVTLAQGESVSSGLTVLAQRDTYMGPCLPSLTHGARESHVRYRYRRCAAGPRSVTCRAIASTPGRTYRSRERTVAWRERGGQETGVLLEDCLGPAAGEPGPTGRVPLPQRVSRCSVGGCARSLPLPGRRRPASGTRLKQAHQPDQSHRPDAAGAADSASTKSPSRAGHPAPLPLRSGLVGEESPSAVDTGPHSERAVGQFPSHSPRSDVDVHFADYHGGVADHFDALHKVIDSVVHVMGVLALFGERIERVQGSARMDVGEVGMTEISEAAEVACHKGVETALLQCANDVRVSCRHVFLRLGPGFVSKRGWCDSQRLRAASLHPGRVASRAHLGLVRSVECSSPRASRKGEAFLLFPS
ncbi:hypothetical protein SHJG_8636 [Streptomyces hygroscopicus subsp. jinggangensis 5008]|nr:hypothetical protein SHJG_8636 [Streptomyces hygroscopicus subsp. jinggangensis 5008]AGF68058.1 hypothetical protein SHJGH_8396 [Streptomyces hygroscopicus subsp. jinggangensis TL01]